MKKLLFIPLLFICSVSFAARWDGWHYCDISDIDDSLPSGYTYIQTSWYKPQYDTAPGTRNQYIDGTRIDKWRIYIANEPTTALKLKLKILKMNQSDDDDADYYSFVTDGDLHDGFVQGWNTVTESSPLEFERGSVIGLYVEGESVTTCWNRYTMDMDRLVGDMTISDTLSINNVQGSSVLPWDDLGFSIQFHTYNDTDSTPNISGIVDNTTYLTISGVNFGDKTTAAPKVWWDMEDQTFPFSSSSEWQYGQLSDDTPYVSITDELIREGAGNYVMKGDWYQAAVNGRGETHISFQQYPGIVNGDKWYIFYHFYHDFDRWGTTADDKNLSATLSQDCTIGTNVLYLTDTTGYNTSDNLVIDNGMGTIDGFSYTGIDGNNLTGVSGIGNDLTAGSVVREDSWAGNWKWNRTWTSSSNPNCYYASGTSGQVTRAQEFQSDGGGNTTYFGNIHSGVQKIREWHNMETYYDLDDTADDLAVNNVTLSATGFMECIIDGTVIDRGHFLKNGNKSHKLQEVGFHCPRTRITQGVKEGYATYLDDIYVDDTPQRVMLTNNADYWSSTVKEIAIPVSWTDESITVEYNEKSLAGGDIYVHVFNDENIVTETGFLLSESSEPAQEPVSGTVSGSLTISVT